MRVFHFHSRGCYRGDALTTVNILIHRSYMGIAITRENLIGTRTEACILKGSGPLLHVLTFEAILPFYVTTRVIFMLVLGLFTIGVMMFLGQEDHCQMYIRMLLLGGQRAPSDTKCPLLPIRDRYL